MGYFREALKTTISVSTTIAGAFQRTRSSRRKELVSGLRPGCPPQTIGGQQLIGKPLEIWPSMDVFGAHIPGAVRENIRNADALVCDITCPNLNVYYETGFAIGLGKTVAPVVNSSFAHAVSDIQRDGIFDTIGYKTYDNSDQLAKIIIGSSLSTLTSLYARPINFQQPLFLLNAFRKTDFINAITSAIKSSKVFFRSFDPAEIPRFSTISIIGDATASAGMIIPLLSEHVDDAPRHNLRAAFLAGLAHGLGRQALLLQLQHQNQVAPVDYRDLVH